MKRMRTVGAWFVCMCVGLLSGAAGAAGLCVSRQTDTSVTFAIEPDGFDYSLYVAHGAADGGEDKYAWDAFAKVADIPGGTTSYEYEVPASLRDGRPMRFFLMQTTGLDMAKEFSSITSTGE